MVCPGVGVLPPSWLDAGAPITNTGARHIRIEKFSSLALAALPARFYRLGRIIGGHATGGLLRRQCATVACPAGGAIDRTLHWPGQSVELKFRRRLDQRGAKPVA
jgi:hypothetical protein